MDCNSYEEIQEQIEKILDNGEMKFKKYMKYLDVAKKRKNINIEELYRKKYNGYRLLDYNDKTDSYIEKWCKECKLPDYVCVTDILKSNKNEIIEKYGKLEYTFDETSNVFDNEAEYIKYITQHKLHKSLANDDKQGMFYETSITKDKRVYSFDECNSEIENLKEGSNLGISYQGDGEKIGSIKTRLYRCYTDINDHTTIKYILRVCKVLKKTLVLPDNINNSPFILMDDMNILYSEIKNEYKDKEFPENYYWKTPDGWLFLHMDSKPDIISLNITSPDSDVSSVTSSEPDSNIIQFTTDCCSLPTSTQLRFGIADIYNIYKTWCKNKNKKHLNRALFKDEFEKLNYKEDKHKGVNINGKSGKRGYNIMVELK